MRLSDLDYQGYGVYGGYGGMGDLPVIPGMPQPGDLLAVEGGLQVVPTQYRQLLMQLFNGTALVDKIEAPGKITGKVMLLLNPTSLGGGWASNYVQSGYAVMVMPSSIATGQLLVMVSNTPAGVAAAAAAATGAYAVVDGPAALLAAARATLQPATPPPGHPPGVEDCQPGWIVTPTGCKQQVVPPGAPPPGTSGTTPSWVIPAVVGVGVLALGALLIKRG